MKIRIMGCGNIIAGDDGIGISILETLKSYSLPSCVELVQGDIRGLDLIDYFLDANKVIIVDAVCFNGIKGHCLKLKLNDITSMSNDHIISLHQIGLPEVLKMSGMLYPDNMADEIVLIGIEIGRIENTFHLSPEVEASIPEAIKLILEELKCYA